MTKLLCALLAVWAQLTLVSCTTKGVALSPLTEQERQGLGTIGIMAELSGTEISYSRPPFLEDSGFQEVRDRLHEAAQEDVDRDKQGKRVEEFKGVKCRNQECLGVIPLYLAGKMIERHVGRDTRSVDRNLFSNTLFMGLMEKSATRAVRDSIDFDGLVEKFRDEVLTRAQKNTAHRFELVQGASIRTAEVLGEHGNETGAQYLLLHDKGITTLLNIKIPLIEFRGSEPDGPYQLFIHVETTLLHTVDGSSIRRNTLVYRGGSLRVTEWNRDGARLLIDGLNQGFRLLAQRVVRELFE